MIEVYVDQDELQRRAASAFGEVVMSVAMPSPIGGIVDALSGAFGIETHRVFCGASVGAACFGQGDTTDVDELLYRADLAPYRARTACRGRFSL